MGTSKADLPALSLYHRSAIANSFQAGESISSVFHGVLANGPMVNHGETQPGPIPGGPEKHHCLTAPLLAQPHYTTYGAGKQAHDDVYRFQSVVESLADLPQVGLRNLACNGSAHRLL
jgi:hypothetical protein